MKTLLRVRPNSTNFRNINLLTDWQHCDLFRNRKKCYIFPSAIVLVRVGVGIFATNLIVGDVVAHW